MRNDPRIRARLRPRTLIVRPPLVAANAVACNALIDRTWTVSISKLRLDVDAVVRRIGPLLAADLDRERVERRVECQPQIGSRARRWTLTVYGIGARVLRNYIELVGVAILLLPQPEDAIDKAVMEEEDRIQSGSIVLAHVTVCAINRRRVEDFRKVESSDSEMNAVMGAFDRNDPLRSVVKPLRGGRCIGEYCVIRSVEARQIFVFDCPPGTGFPSTTTVSDSQLRTLSLRRPTLVLKLGNFALCNAVAARSSSVPTRPERGYRTVS